MFQKESDRIKKNLILFINKLSDIGLLNADKYTLNLGILNEIMIQYNIMNKYIKKSDRIYKKTITANKSGLIAYLIIRYKPWVLKNGNDERHKNDGNEIIAIYHGILLCSLSKNVSDSYVNLDDFINNTNFNKWQNLFKLILKTQNYSFETLILLFDTIRKFIFDINEI